MFPSGFNNKKMADSITPVENIDTNPFPEDNMGHKKLKGFVKNIGQLKSNVPEKRHAAQNFFKNEINKGLDSSGLSGKNEKEEVNEQLAPAPSASVSAPVQQTNILPEIESKPANEIEQSNNAVSNIEDKKPLNENQTPEVQEANNFVRGKIDLQDKAIRELILDMFDVRKMSYSIPQFSDLGEVEGQERINKIIEIIEENPDLSNICREFNTPDFFLYLTTDHAKKFAHTKFPNARGSDELSKKKEIIEVFTKISRWIHVDNIDSESANMVFYVSQQDNLNVTLNVNEADLNKALISWHIKQSSALQEEPDYDFIERITTLKNSNTEIFKYLLQTENHLALDAVSEWLNAQNYQPLNLIIDSTLGKLLLDWYVDYEGNKSKLDKNFIKSASEKSTDEILTFALKNKIKDFYPQLKDIFDSKDIDDAHREHYRTKAELQLKEDEETKKDLSYKNTESENDNQDQNQNSDNLVYEDVPASGDNPLDQVD